MIGLPTYARGWSILGVPLQVHSAVPSLDQSLLRWLSGFGPPAKTPVATNAIQVYIYPFVPQQVLRALSPQARPIASDAADGDIYQDGERFWRVDERWGLGEIHLLKRTAQSWILPHTKIDAMQCASRAILHPLFHLLRGRGLHCLPAATLSRGGWTVLLIGKLDMEPEIRAALRAGYRLLGASWSTLSLQADGRPLVHLTHSPMVNARGQWIDWGQEFGTPAGDLAACCDAVALIAPSRRSRPRWWALPAGQRTATLRRDWPIRELHPHKRSGQIAANLAAHCLIAQAELSSDPHAFLSLMDQWRSTSPAGLTSTPIRLAQSPRLGHPATAPLVLAG